MRIEWLYEAQCEFEELLSYYRSRGGKEAAAGFAEKILSAVERLAVSPRAGVLRRNTPLGKHGFRALLVEQYACIYRIEDGIVRIYHLTDAGRDDLYEILGVASSATDREMRTVRNNVFLKSTLRQPVKTALLLAVMALITFAFVSRGAEYLLVKQETERLGSYYRSIGTLEASGGKTNREDALAYLKANPYVKMTDQVRYGSAVMEGVYNLGAGEASTAKLYHEDAFFYGTLTDVAVGTTLDSSGGQRPNYIFSFSVDTVLAGYPEAVEAGDTVSLISPSENKMTKTSYADLTGLYREMEVGQRYLVRGEHASYDLRSQLKNSLGGTYLVFKELSHGGPWYVPVPKGQEADFSATHLANTAKQIQLFDGNQHSLSAIITEDAGALAAVWQDKWNPYLLEGRWPDSQDNSTECRVCAIHESLAARRGLSVGDTLTLTLRDARARDGYLCDPEDLVRAEEIAVSGKEGYEIIGIFSAEKPWSNCKGSIFIPASARPESFQNGARAGLDDVLFELSSPAVEEDFTAETVDALSALGVRPVMLETAWKQFQRTVKPMRQTSLFNAVVFSTALLATLCLTAVLYCRMRRRDIAISRALGVLAGQCLRGASLPLLLVGALGVASGGIWGWRYTLENAGETLRSLAEFGGGENAALSGFWLVVLLGTVFLLLAALTVGGVFLLLRTPVLSLMQGQMVQKRAVPVEEVPALSTGRTLPSTPGRVPSQAANIPAPAKSTGAVHVLRFVWRHIARAKVRTALGVLLAVSFTVALAFIWLSIEENEGRVNELYNSTVVTVDIIRDDNQTRVVGRRDSDGYIGISTVRAVQDTGFVSDAYLEGGNSAKIFVYDEWVKGQNLAQTDVKLTRTAVRSFDDLEEFLENSGSSLSIMYHEGWDETLFAQNWAAIDAEAPDEDPALFPILLPRYLYRKYSLEPGSTIGVTCGRSLLCQVAGYYEGTVEGSKLSMPLLMPNSAVEAMTGDKMLYAKAQFSLDPARNRDLSQFRTALDGIIDKTKSKLTLRAVVRDDELRQAVEPLEDSIVLMKLLYPVVLALSLLVAAGIAVLFVITSAKEAAIMRVLGTSRLRSRVMLALQTAFTSAVGLLIGLAGVLAYTGRTRPELLAGLVGASALYAMLYLLAAIIGAAASSTVVTSKNPLELLQVRE